MSLTVSSIVSMHGQVYKDSGQSMKDLKSKFYAPSVTDALFGLTPSTETVKHMGKAKASRVLQLFQKGWTPIGGLTIEGLEAKLTKLKVDVEEYPDDVEDTWVGFLANLDVNEREKWPFVRWWLNEHVMPQSVEDWELLEVYHGTGNTITTPGTANASGLNFIGLRKQINTLITAGKIDNSTTVTGAVDADAEDWVAQIEAWVKLCKERSTEDRIIWESGQIREICMSPALRDHFKRGMRKKYNMTYPQVPNDPTKMVDDNLYVIDSNIRVVGLPSMIGDDKIWATPSWNRWGFIKRPKSSTYFSVSTGVANPRAVSALMDFWKGVGFWMPEYVYTNDLELV
jgi:hypothetical protein